MEQSATEQPGVSGDGGGSLIYPVPIQQRFLALSSCAHQCSMGAEHMAHEKSIPGTPSFPEPTNQSKAAFLKNQLCSLTKCPLLLPNSPEPKGRSLSFYPSALKALPASLSVPQQQPHTQSCPSHWAHSAACHTDRQNPQ